MQRSGDCRDSILVVGSNSAGVNVVSRDSGRNGEARSGVWWWQGASRYLWGSPGLLCSCPLPGPFLASFPHLQNIFNLP